MSTRLIHWFSNSLTFVISFFPPSLYQGYRFHGDITPFFERSTSSLKQPQPIMSTGLRFVSVLLTSPIYDPQYSQYIISTGSFIKLHHLSISCPSIYVAVTFQPERVVVNKYPFFTTSRPDWLFPQPRLPSLQTRVFKLLI